MTRETYIHGHTYGAEEQYMVPWVKKHYHLIIVFPKTKGYFFPTADNMQSCCPSQNCNEKTQW